MHSLHESARSAIRVIALDQNATQCLADPLPWDLLAETDGVLVTAVSTIARSRDSLSRTASSERQARPRARPSVSFNRLITMPVKMNSPT